MRPEVGLPAAVKGVRQIRSVVAAREVYGPVAAIGGRSILGAPRKIPPNNLLDELDEVIIGEPK